MTTTKPLITADFLLRTPDLGRCELVCGELIEMTPAGYQHGRIIDKIHTPLSTFVSRSGLGHVVGAETGFYIAHDPDTVRAPDVAFVAAERLPSPEPKGFFPGPPDLAVEVVSPDDRDSQVTAKVQNWLEAGCRVVWLVDPRRQTVQVFQTRSEARVFGVSDTLSGEPLLPGFSLAVAEIFKNTGVRS
jgi:Uma2 family endonuclease